MAKAAAKKRVKWIRYVLLAVLLLGAYHILSGPSGVLNLLRLNSGNQAQVQALDTLAARKAALEMEKRRLESDSAYLEKVARKELGMSKPGEKVFRFVEPQRPKKK